MTKLLVADEISHHGLRIKISWRQKMAETLMMIVEYNEWHIQTKPLNL